MCKKLIILVLLVVHQLPSATANEETLSGVELRNLRWDWEVYDEEVNQYVPFFKQPNTKAIRFKLDFNKYKNSEVKLLLTDNCFVWIEDELVYRTMGRELVFFSLDSIQAIYKKNEVNMTIFSPQFNEKKISTAIVNEEEGTYSISKDWLLKKRIDQSQIDSFIIISIVTLSLIALFRSFNYRLFQEYFSLSRSLQLRQNFDLIIAHSPIAWPNIGFVIFYAILVGNSFMNIGLFQSDVHIDFPFGLSKGNRITMGLKISGCCFALMLLKWLLILITSELFKIQKARHLHFFTYFRHSLIIAITMFILSVIYGIFEGSLITKGWSVIQAMVVAVWSGRLILIFFVLNKIYTFRKLHLFSYLCSTELIPLLLFFKIFLK
ncbi:MAG: DUF4271 domain-containing protein [Reichenbachiella sp.]|uniref:DUF4271 domain-containing protein n=1 Tax=Reichenbachiella sp. TaxID=2184521 RepID=UPI003267D251